MKKSEKILLVVTVGLGAVLSAVYLPGRGGTTPAPASAGSTPAAPSAAKETRPATVSRQSGPPTLELLAAGGVELIPLPEEMRNPFRPVTTVESNAGVPVVLRVTAVFGQDENLAALLCGEHLAAGRPANRPVVYVDADAGRVDAYLRGERLRLSSGEAQLVALLRGKLVRAGDTVGQVTVEEVTPRGVALRYEGKRISVEFEKRSGDQDPFGSGGAAAQSNGSEATEPNQR